MAAWSASHKNECRMMAYAKMTEMLSSPTAIPATPGNFMTMSHAKRLGSLTLRLKNRMFFTWFTTYLHSSSCDKCLRLSRNSHCAQDVSEMIVKAWATFPLLALELTDQEIYSRSLWIQVLHEHGHSEDSRRCFKELMNALRELEAMQKKRKLVLDIKKRLIIDMLQIRLRASESDVTEEELHEKGLDLLHRLRRAPLKFLSLQLFDLGICVYAERGNTIIGRRLVCQSLQLSIQHSTPEKLLCAADMCLWDGKPEDSMRYLNMTLQRYPDYHADATFRAALISYDVGSYKHVEKLIATIRTPTLHDSVFWEIIRILMGFKSTQEWSEEELQTNIRRVMQSCCSPVRDYVLVLAQCQNMEDGIKAFRENQNFSDLIDILEDIEMLQKKLVFGKWSRRFHRLKESIRVFLQEAEGFHDLTDQDDGDKDCCPVCLDDLRQDDGVEKLDCGHMYHSTCLMAWRQTCDVKKQEFCCPYCRTRLK